MLISKAYQLVALLAHTLLLATPLLVAVINGQISTPCTVSMITSFTPCLNFITGSSNGGRVSPTTGCCGALKSIVESGSNCACLLIAANVPVQLPINRTLALSLPRACKMKGVPLQCKPSGTPLPAPGPVLLLGPSLPPTIAASPFSPTASEVSASAPAPQSKAIEQLTPAASPRQESEGPAKAAGIRQVLNPPVFTSMSKPDNSPSHLQHVFVVVVAFKTVLFNRFI